MKDGTGEIIYACGKRYTEVPQNVIDKLAVGMEMCVYKNEDKQNIPQPAKEISCFSCPCKRRAKRKKDMFYRKVDIDPKTDRAIHRPSGIVITCAVAELKDSKV